MLTEVSLDPWTPARSQAAPVVSFHRSSIFAWPPSPRDTPVALICTSSELGVIFIPRISEATRGVSTLGIERKMFEKMMCSYGVRCVSCGL